jgi:hypothetical protein
MAASTCARMNRTCRPSLTRGTVPFLPHSRTVEIGTIENWERPREHWLSETDRLTREVDALPDVGLGDTEQNAHALRRSERHVESCHRTPRAGP